MIDPTHLMALEIAVLLAVVTGLGWKAFWFGHNRVGPIFERVFKP